jgi:hypothetical protein
MDVELTAQRADRVDLAYYEVARPGTAAESLMAFCRRRMFRHFMDICVPSDDETILDVGVSDVVETGDNMLERMYPRPGNITAVGRGHGRDFRARFPEVPFVSYAETNPLPFEDDRFDFAVSNAVLEHVGSTRAQRHLLSEMLRVAPRVFVTVPNRYFPVEHHTGLPLLGASDRLFRVGCRWFGKEKWADPSMLILMNRARLAAVAPLNAVRTIGYTGVVAGPFSSNLYLLLDRRLWTRRISADCAEASHRRS